MDSPQVDPPPNVSIDEAQPLHTPPLRKSSRVGNVPLRYNFIIENNNTPYIIENDDLMIYSEAIMSDYSNKWLEAIKFKMDSMYANQV